MFIQCFEKESLLFLVPSDVDSDPFSVSNLSPNSSGTSTIDCDEEPSKGNRYKNYS